MCISLCSYNILHKNTKGNDHELNNVEDINSTIKNKRKKENVVAIWCLITWKNCTHTNI